MQIKKYFIIILVCLCLTGCSTSSNVDGTSNKDDINYVVIDTETSKFINEYKNINSYIEVNIPNETKIHYARTEEVLDLVTSGTGIIYFGRPTCPWCRNIIPVLAKVANTNNMVINYYNPGEVSADESYMYVSIKNKLSDYLRSNENGEKAFYLPDVYFIKDGNVIGHKLGSLASQTDAYIPLTDEQVKELSDLYQSYINDMK